jgi:hypothetical protein
MVINQNSCFLINPFALNHLLFLHSTDEWQESSNLNDFLKNTIINSSEALSINRQLPSTFSLKNIGLYFKGHTDYTLRSYLSVYLDILINFAYHISNTSNFAINRILPPFNLKEYF